MIRLKKPISTTTLLVAMTTAVFVGETPLALASEQCNAITETGLEKLARWVSDEPVSPYERCQTALRLDNERRNRDAEYLTKQPDSHFRESLLESEAIAISTSQSGIGQKNTLATSIYATRDDASRLPSKRIDTLTGYTTKAP